MADFSALGKMMVLLGAGMVVLGAVLWLAGRVPFLGHLPGDVTLRRGNWSCHFPIVTSILLSLALTLLLNLITRILNQ